MFSVTLFLTGEACDTMIAKVNEEKDILNFELQRLNRALVDAAKRDVKVDEKVEMLQDEVDFINSALPGMAEGPAKTRKQKRVSYLEYRIDQLTKYEENYDEYARVQIELEIAQRQSEIGQADLLLSELGAHKLTLAA